MYERININARYITARYGLSECYREIKIGFGVRQRELLRGGGVNDVKRVGV